MGQDQSFIAHSSVAPVRRYKNKYEDPIPYRTSPVTYRSDSYEDTNYKRQNSRRSADSFTSDNSSTESSGYRSGSSAYERRSDKSSKSDYYCTSLYKNDHYKDIINKELYKPVKIPKEKRYKVQLFNIDRDETKAVQLKKYLSDTEKAKLKAGPTKKAGIRNYTPKILSEGEQRKKLDSWI